MSDPQGVQGSTKPRDDGTIDVGDIHDRSSPYESSAPFLGALPESVTSRSSSGKMSGIPGRPDNSPIQPLLWTATRTSDARAYTAPHPLSVPKNPFLDEQLNIGINGVHRSTTAPASSTNDNPADPTRSDVRRETVDPEDSASTPGKDKDFGSMEGDDDNAPEVNGGDVGIGDDDGDDALDVVGGEPERIAGRPAPSEREERGFIDVGALGDGREGGAVVSLRAATGMLHNGGENSHGGGNGCRVSCLGDFKFTADEVHRMSKRYPTLRAMGSETAVPLLSWLAEELGMNLNEMRNLIMRHPRLMAYRVKSHLEPKTKWLRERLQLSQDQLRKLVITYPAVLSRSVESNLEPKLKWLEERLVATEDEVSLLIRRFPVLFGYSTTKNLEPTISFFMGEMRAATQEVKSTVMSCPAILSRSLEKRIIPRAQQMQAREIVPTFELHKWVVTTYTDAQFSKWLDGMRGEIDVRRKQVAQEKQAAEERRLKHQVANDEGRTEGDSPPARSPPDKRLRRGAASSEDPGSWWRRGVRPSPS